MGAVMRLDSEESSAPITGTLTDKQRLFVRALVRNGGNATGAAEEAGYGDPRSRGWELMQLPHVLAAIRAETERMMAGGGAKAVGWMVKALDDTKLAGAVRFQCAKWLAEAAGHGLAAQRAALGLPGADKPLSEMTLDELDAFIAAGKAGVEHLKRERLAQQERTIEGEVRKDVRSDDSDPAG